MWSELVVSVVCAFDLEKAFVLHVRCGYLRGLLPCCLVVFCSRAPTVGAPACECESLISRVVASFFCFDLLALNG